jgi:hypothetical protein
MGPAPSGPDAHFHRSISESFFILSGTVRIYDGTRWIDTVPRDFVHVPEGGIHAFRNESGEPASMLLHFAPGAPTSKGCPTWQARARTSGRSSFSATIRSGSDRFLGVAFLARVRSGLLGPVILLAASSSWKHT